MNDEYIYDFFLEVKGLRFEQLETDEQTSAMMQALENWLPRGKGTQARMHNADAHNAYVDYIVMMEDMIYFTILLPEGQGYRLRSIKAFRAADIIGHAFILEGAPGAPPADEPQMRLMLREGLLVRLVFDEAEHDRTVAQLEELATKRFFMS